MQAKQKIFYRALLITTFLFISVTASAYTRKEQKKLNAEYIQNYMNQLTAKRQNELRLQSQKIMSVKMKLVSASLRDEAYLNTNKVILFAHGVSPKTEELYIPLDIFDKAGLPAYALRWRERAKLKTNTKLFKEAFLQLKQKYGEHTQIIIFGYSAGGLIALKAFDDWATENYFPTNMQYHLISSPVNGYNAPRFGTPIMNILAGYTTVAIGQGMYRLLKYNEPLSCTQWLTTNCELDINACAHKKGFPQIINPLPCGADHTLSLNDQTHYTVLPKVIKLALGI